ARAGLPAAGGDGRRRLPPPGAAAPAARGGAPWRRPRDRLALGAAGSGARLAAAPPAAVARGESVRPRDAGAGRGRRDRGVPAVPGRAARAPHRRGHRLPGVLLPDRHDPPRPGPGRRDRGGADRLRRARRRGEQDVLRHRGRGAGEGDVLGTLTSRPGPSHGAALAWTGPRPQEGSPTWPPRSPPPRVIPPRSE